MNKYEEYLEAKNWDITFRYIMLDRMRSDCDYFLGYGYFYEKHLWAGNVTDQIGYMKALWESFPADGKPEWLPMEQINEYEQKMTQAGNFKEETEMIEQTAEKNSLYQQQENPSIWDRASDQQSCYQKRVALEIIDQLHQNSRLDSADYDAIHDGLCEIEPLRDRDDVLEELWDQLGDVPMDPETECIEAPFLGWGPGTNREEIWHWFDCRHSKGVAHLLHSVGNDKAGQFSRMMYLRQLCTECTSAACQFNHGGECRFAMVHERKPRISDEDGCTDYNYHQQVLASNHETSKLVYICAPLRGDVAGNIEYARQRAREVFQAGEIPVCPHLMFPPIADPGDAVEDQAARDMGLRLVEICQQVNVYGKTYTAGMQAEIDLAKKLGIPVEVMGEDK